MAIPSAAVTVQVLSLQSVPAATPAPGNTRYARGLFKAGSAPPVRTGRSRPLPDAGGNFDLTAEGVPWVFDAWVEPGTAIEVTVEVFEDRGDAGPPPPQTTSGTVPDPWKPGDRVLAGTPAVTLRVASRLVKPNDKAFIARANAAAGVSATLKVPQGYAVEFVSIDGLYQPASSIAIPAPGANKVAGYISADNAGRVYTNRDAAGAWLRDNQYIDVVARITAFGGLPLPAGAKIEWTVVDMDDPTNDASDFHRDAGRYVDPNDYTAGGLPLGAQARDNASAYAAGNADEDIVFGASAKGTARWAALGGYPGPAPASREQATSPLKSISATVGEAGVRIHCTNVLGTNFRLRAAANGTPGPNFDTRSGVITMWSRIDVEVVRMAAAHSLAGALPALPPLLHPACVQLDFQVERSVSGATLDKAEMAPDDDQVGDATSAWINDAKVFKKSGQAGWFFLGAACLPNPKPATKPPAHKPASYRIGMSGLRGWVEIPGSHPTADYLKFSWTAASGAALSAGFSVYKVDTAVTAGHSRLMLRANDVTPDFTGHDSDGSLAHAYKSRILIYPRNQVAGGVAGSGGFDVPAAGATLEVWPPGAVGTSGISPGVLARAAPVVDEEYFAGRTVLFTHHTRFSTPPPAKPLLIFDQQVLGTVLHEFLHAFGMPHKCGARDWRTPIAKSCCMNYFNTWLIDGSKRPLPGTTDLQGRDTCGRHLMEVRRVHLERNKGLGW